MELLQESSRLQLAAQIAKSYYNLSGSFKPLVGEKDWNFYLKTEQASYILKIQAIGTDRQLIEMQHAAMLHLADQSISLQTPLPVPNKNGQYLFELDTEKGARLIHLLTWVDGRLMAEVYPHTTDFLYQLGQKTAEMTQGLESFRHPAAPYEFDWNPSRVAWTEAHYHLMDAEQEAIARYFLQLFKEQAQTQLLHLRKATLHYDVNDYNVLASEDKQRPEVLGLIDFGDMHESHLINEVAIAIAYAAMHKKDPLKAAAALVQGYHSTFALEEAELAVLFPMVAARLLLTITFSAINKHQNPDNEYLLVSEAPAWQLLRQLRSISPQLAHFTFRDACGFEPCPMHLAFQQWLSAANKDFASIVDFNFESNAFHQPDLSIGSLDLGHNKNFETQAAFSQTMQRMLKGKVGVGGYAEIRPVYTTDAYIVETDNGPQWRSMHLGIDIWMEAESPLMAPLDGIVHALKDNAAERDYGPTVILRHEPQEGLVFYTLYGHLSRASLDKLTVGQAITKGSAFAQIGQAPENGNWPPHVHFQLIMDMLAYEGDFPGATFYDQASLWKSICPDPNLLLNSALKPSEATEPEDLLPLRRSRLGEGLSLSYSQPLHIERAYMQYLYDHSGRRYLDTVNNVPHVGHQHPQVVEAAQRQMQLLNTNTRYLHKNILAFAEKLLATFPPELCVVHFVNSGSEANELALRMAKAYSAQQDMIVLEAGYHGNTNACVEISSYKFEGKGGAGLSPKVEMAVAPDVYRGAYKADNPEAGRLYAASVADAIKRMQAKGRNIAGFIHESILSCGGQLVLPEGYLRAAYAEVRAAGGLCIADEVQVGFGRVGDAFWGFELQGVVPDVVTMGKPIGNGHPLGAVVCTRAVADAFNNGMEYFNTFGGNPVSCAVGLEVLNIIEKEGLQAHALKLGNYLKNHLCDLQKRYPLIGDVRGHGLFLGFELVRERETLEPAAEAAGYLANRMREHGILMSTDGPLHNVIKIKPPMCFDKANADFLLATLDKVFQEDFLRS